MKRFKLFYSILTVFSILLTQTIWAGEPLDRTAIVGRHNIESVSLPLQIPIGDGQFCFNVDGTGLQTFGGSTISHDGWAYESLPEGFCWDDIPGTGTFQKGRNNGPDLFPSDKEQLRQWLFDNPHRANLARIRLTKKNGIPLQESELEGLTRKMTLWTGIHTSSFLIQQTPVSVETCLGNDGIIAIRISSELLAKGELEVVVDFPYPSLDNGPWIGRVDSEHPAILSEIEKSDNSIMFVRKLLAEMKNGPILDSSRFVQIGWNQETPCRVELPTSEFPGRFRLIGKDSTLEIFARFAACSCCQNESLQSVLAQGKIRSYVPSNISSSDGVDPKIDNDAAIKNELTENRQTIEETSPSEKGTTKISEKKPRTEFKNVYENEYKDSIPNNKSADFLTVGQNGEYCSLPPDFACLTFDRMKQESEERWETFWKSGGAVDLSGSRDSRWFELERRIVLSQFQMRTNAAGDYPCSETGLLGTDPWRGQFHMEMIFWHLTHYYLWGRSDFAKRSVSCYFRFSEPARQLAEQLNYAGLKWQKSVGPEARTAPWTGNQVLLWKQPHPIFFAELEYRVQPTKQTLEKWAKIIEGTADHMADYPKMDAQGIAHLDPVMPPSEQGITRDSVFDLAYWRWGLDKANEWRERMGQDRNCHWDEIRENLAPLPVNEDGFFVHSAEWFDTYSKRNWEHPDPVGVLGMLPPIKGVDEATATRTLTKIYQEWQWDRCWGWDFPWTAMAAARTGQPELALEILLNDSPRNQYDERGVNVGGPCPYLPGNGGLLYVIAMMCAGWDVPLSNEQKSNEMPLAESQSKELSSEELQLNELQKKDSQQEGLSVREKVGLPDAPGFPNNGQWTVCWEGLLKAL